MERNACKNCRQTAMPSENVFALMERQEATAVAVANNVRRWLWRKKAIFFIIIMYIRIWGASSEEVAGESI